MCYWLFVVAALLFIVCIVWLVVNCWLRAADCFFCWCCVVGCLWLVVCGL